ncbi:50S ribosomal protein L3 N(5)-glutamine methyltransferase [Azospira inquinata]|uniref:Ribosomal protein uL3 glutamine methyltransferase n=1 Tax=Azospira inquinata TaxID=2785627 RepID=A0A975SNH5_9RHOO|nr:50S ribosomal protein L3 N(5)-glutamine methyltransferase [Azospira inquinata]QWT45574.1 50S ribosomal protein L3 N(5)-glutamine methyltransferase [Azospira inquinata]QWT49100.1 50S ribosomal protein L3 N(5)-glutamine methyltransferase [Azospira inquinata]
MALTPSDLPELQTLRDFLRYGVSRFNQAQLFFGHGTDNAYDEAAYLLLHTLNLPLDRLEPFLDAHLTAEERQTVLSVIEQRVESRVPAAYLTHEAWLGEHRFYVDSRVIVPRSFIAELLDEQLLPWVEDPWGITRVADICTGSGCLAILAALAFPMAEVDGVDISPDALDVAQRNIADYGLEDRVHAIRSNLFAGVARQRYDLIISNPPYVNAPSMAELPPEYRAEPELALAGGEDGLDLVRILLREARDHLNPGGILVVEIGHNREALEAAYPETPFTWLETSAGDQFVFLLHREELPE